MIKRASQELVRPDGMRAVAAREQRRVQFAQAVHGHGPTRIPAAPQLLEAGLQVRVDACLDRLGLLVVALLTDRLHLSREHIEVAEEREVVARVLGPADLARALDMRPRGSLIGGEEACAQDVLAASAREDQRIHVAVQRIGGSLFGREPHVHQERGDIGPIALHVPRIVVGGIEPGDPEPLRFLLEHGLLVRHVLLELVVGEEEDTRDRRRGQLRALEVALQLAELRLEGVHVGVHGAELRACQLEERDVLIVPPEYRILV